MSWLTLAYFISLGSLSYWGQTMNARSLATFAMPSNSFQTTLGVEAQAFDNHAFVGASVETWETSLGTAFFAPAESFYKFSAGLRAWGFEIGYRHECDHPTISAWGNATGLLSMKDEFYLSYTGKLKVF